MSDRSDNFNRANSGTLGTPSDGGSAWVDSSGDGSISSNEFLGINLFTWTPAYLEASTTDGVISATVKSLGNSGLVLRYVDSSNFWFANIYSSGLSIYKRVSGVNTLYGSSYSGTISVNDVIAFEVTSGDVWTAKQNGTLRVNPGTSDSANNTGTKVGIVNYNGSARYDDMSFTDTASGGVTGTSATTNANDTSSASGTTTVVGTAAATNANDTATASGVVGNPVVGTSATTNADDTSSASGTTTVTGTSATTNADDSPAASGWSGAVTGTAAVTNADDTAQASGTVEGGFPFGGTGGGLSQIKPRESEEQKRTRRIAQGIIREAQKPAADVEKLAKKAEKVSAQLKADIAYFEALAKQDAREIEQTRLAMQARNDALATRQLEQRMIQAQLLAEAAAQQREELDVVFMAVMLAAME